MSSKTTTAHKMSPTAGRPAHNSPAQIIAAICGIAPPMQTCFSVQDHMLASTNNPDILDQLRCPLCLTIVHQPLELPLPCRALVCTNCIVHWFMASNCSEVKCPSGHSSGSFTAEAHTTTHSDTAGRYSGTVPANLWEGDTG